MTNKEAINLLTTDVKAWNEWRRSAEASGEELPDLGLAYLGGANLDGADLRGMRLLGAAFGLSAGGREPGASLRGADLRGADLTSTFFADADLSGADLSGVIAHDCTFIRGTLGHANLARSDLGFATFRDITLSNSLLNHARLDGTKFDGVEADGVDFGGAECSRTAFLDVDLSRARNLDTVVHRAPSTMGISSIYRSGGKIPREFLLACGVPETFIEIIPDLIRAAGPAEFYSCFISYSHRDEEFARRLFSRLRDSGLRVWYAPEEMKAGRKLHEQIHEAIRLHDKLLLVLSEHSMASEWVRTEVYNARQREVREGRRVLFPVALCPFERVQEWQSFDADTGKDLAREVREYFIPDFSDWKDHDRFEAAFTRLLRDLRAEEPATKGGGGASAGGPGGVPATTP